MAEKTLRDTLYLAALFHDIGKFYQRADDSFEQSKRLSPEVKGLIDFICPETQKGFFGFQHVVWTYQFLHEKREKLKKIGFEISPFRPDHETEDNLVNLAIFHHRPATRLQAFIQYADWWASGMDRRKAPEYQTEVTGKDKYKKVPMLSIFSRLADLRYIKEEKNERFHFEVIKNENGKGISTAPKRFFPLREYGISDAHLMPVESEDGLVSQEQYAQLWKRFDNEFDILPDDPHAFIQSVYFLLKKYTSRIPASTIDVADGSLFNHSRLTAALALSLLDYDRENPDAFSYNPQKKHIELIDGHYPLLLAGGDISGIQSFIGDISSKGATRSLRGRSFYIQMIGEALSQEILQRCDVHDSHIVYASGGNFYMILPNTPHNIKNLELIRREMESFLWDKFEGILSATVTYIPFTYDKNLKDFPNRLFVPNIDKPMGLSDLWTHLAMNLASGKNQKFSTKLSEPRFFDAIEEGGLKPICAVTGSEHKVKSFTRKISGKDEVINLSEAYIEQERLGRMLVDHQYLVLADNIISTNLPNDCKPIELPFGRKYWLFSEDELNKFTSLDDAFITRTPDTDFLTISQKLKGKKLAFGFRFYGGSQVPMEQDENEGKSLTFDDLALRSYGRMKRLGVLKMDVDNLGLLFKERVVEPSFSSLATLSGLFDQFFSGFINHLRDQEPYRDKVLIVYSGGDDLFAVGAWDAITRFAADINNQFKNFTGRSDITLSAGIAMIPGKYPISKGIELADLAEQDAKSNIILGKQKDSFNLFQVTLRWEEWPLAEQWIITFGEWLKEGKITMGLLQLLLRYYYIYQAALRDNRTDYSWKWKAAYNLSRRRNNANRDAIKELTELIITKAGTRELRFEVLAVALRWTEFYQSL